MGAVTCTTTEGFGGFPKASQTRLSAETAHSHNGTSFKSSETRKKPTNQKHFNHSVYFIRKKKLIQNTKRELSEVWINYNTLVENQLTQFKNLPPI